MTLAVGTKVRVTGTSKWARMGTWEIVKVNPAKYQLTLVSDPSVKLTAPHEMVEPAGDNAYAGPRRPDGLRVGAIVKFDPPIKGFEPFDLFVVIKDEVDRVRVVLLGGDDRGRYWQLPPFRCTVVTFGTPTE